MKNLALILTVSLSFICLSGCASLMGEAGPDDSPDFASYSQAAPAPDDFGQEKQVDPRDEDYHRTTVAHAIQSRDIVPGMNPEEVLSAWGHPRDVQPAGDAAHGDERWVYYTDNSTLYGISPVKIIYFENGRVSGWETSAR